MFSLKKAKTQDQQKPAAAVDFQSKAVPFPRHERPREAECRVRHHIGSRQLKGSSYSNSEQTRLLHAVMYLSAGRQGQLSTAAW